MNLHILLISHYYEPDSGAAAVRLSRLMKILHRRGHQITVLTTMPHYPQGVIQEQYRAKLFTDENRDGIRVIQVWLWATPSKRIVLRLISQLSFMLTCMVRGLFLPRPDVILIENQPIFTGLAGWFISKIKRTPYVINVSDFWPEYLVVAGITTETSLIYRIFKALTNLTQRDADAITVMYDSLLTKIEDRIGKVENAQVIYNGVDLSLYNKPDTGMSFRDKYDLGEQRLITFLGILGPHINLEMMLESIKFLGDMPDITVLFVSSGSQQDKLLEVLTYPEFAHCRSIDWIPADEVPGFWMASYLTFWALHDNELDRLRFQAKLYEALASGTPTVIAVDGFMSDLLNRTQTGLAVMPNDIKAMQSAIATLLNDAQLYAEMSHNARQYALENFDPEEVASKYETVLKAVAR